MSNFRSDSESSGLDLARRTPGRNKETWVMCNYPDTLSRYTIPIQQKETRSFAFAFTFAFAFAFAKRFFFFTFAFAFIIIIFVNNPI